MAPKRRMTSNANVGAKRGKVARELGRLQKKEDRLEFQSDMEWLKKELEKNPEKMKSLKTVVKMGAAEKYNKDESFNPDLAGRALSRVPVRHLTLEWLPAFNILTNAEISALMKSDSKAPFKMLQRIAIVPLTMPLGPLDKKVWNKCFADRVASVGESLSVIKWNREFNILWDKCGHFMLLPELPEGCEDPAAHIYTMINFKGISVPLTGDCVTFRGTWKIEMNWSHLEAALVNPQRPKEMLFLCMKFFVADALANVAPPMSLPAPPPSSSSSVALPAPEPLLGLENSNGGHDSDAEEKSEAGAIPPSAQTSSSHAPAPSIASVATSLISPTKTIGLPGLRTPPKAPPKTAQAAANFAEALADSNATST